MRHALTVVASARITGCSGSRWPPSREPTTGRPAPPWATALIGPRPGIHPAASAKRYPVPARHRRTRSRPLELLPAGVSGVQLVPVADVVFTLDPAQIHL